jgi:EpsI family protein
MISGWRFWVVVLLLGSSAFALHSLSHGERVVPARPLSLFPMDVSGWRGQALPLTRDVVEAVGVDDYLNRVYTAPDGMPVLLYVGYYQSQRTGRTIHSPKNCLPGAGWQPVSASRVNLTLPDGRRVPVNYYLIERGLDRQLVLYWYQSHGRVIASEYWGKFYMVLDALRLDRTDSALVRVSIPVNHSMGVARSDVVQFAQAVESRLGAFIPQ